MRTGSTVRTSTPSYCKGLDHDEAWLAELATETDTGEKELELVRVGLYVLHLCDMWIHSKFLGDAKLQV